MPTITDAALDYARMGLPVFPCRDKIPILKDWPSRATTDPDQIREWFDVKPAPMIGLVTGPRSGLWVLDLDGPEGQETWSDLVNANGGWADLPMPLTVQTRRGMHYWWRWPEGGQIRNSAGSLGNSVDVRGAGGFVIAPPSRGYRFADSPDDDGIPEAPAWLLDDVRSIIPAEAERPRLEGVHDLVIPIGQRDNALISLAGSMRRRGMGLEEITAALLVVNAIRCEQPMSEAVVRQKAESVCRYPPGDVPDFLLVAEPPKDSRLFTVPASDVVVKEMRWMWPGYLPRGMLTLHAGKQGLGKSYMWCDIMARLSAGEQMPDGTQSKPITILAIMLEDDFGYIVRPRLEASGADLERIHLATDCIRGVSGDGTPFQDRFKVSLHMDILKATIKELGAELVLIDPIGGFLEGDDGGNGAGEVRRLLDPLQELAKDLDIAVLCLAHVRKGSGDQSDPMDIIAGSHQWTAVPRVVHCLTKNSDGDNPVRTITVVKSNVPKPKPCAWRLDESSPGFGAFEGSVEAPRVVWDNTLVRPLPGSLEFARLYLSESPQLVADIMAAVRVDHPGIAESKVRERLKTLGAMGMVVAKRSHPGMTYALGGD